MLRFARASVGLAGFLGKFLVASKKLFSSTIFPDFRNMHTATWFMHIIYIWGSMPGLMFLKKLEFLDNHTHMYVVCIVI